MTIIRAGDFVRSSANRLGVGKFRRVVGKVVTVEYFTAPGQPPLAEDVPKQTISRVVLDSETRVYQLLGDKVAWRAGRALVAHGDDQYFVQFPNGVKEFVPTGELFTRCELPIPDPALFLAARITETPIWQERRAAFVRAIIDQRRACAGLTALFSSAIDIEPHQVEVARRVLHDPVQRYLLADEVGLGKTIEAGVVIRQHVLDYPEDTVLVLVPPHLDKQWRDELTHRFRLGPLLGDTVQVLPHDSDEIDEYGPSAGLVVIDEAHQLARWVAAPARSHERKRFAAVEKILANNRVRLLLLSATPTLHSDEVGFQSLLHLLDPVVYPLGDLEGFRKRLERHETVAQLYHLFRPDEEGGYLEGALDQLTEFFPKDDRLCELAKKLRPLLAYGADADDPKRADLVRAVRAHVSEAYRLHRRLLRNRRADDRVAGLLPGRAGLARWTYTDPAAPRLAALLDEWRVAAMAGASGAKAAKLARVLVLFAEAAACDAGILAALVGVRLGDDPGDTLGLPAADVKLLTDTPQFAGEAALLARLRDAASAAESFDRVDALAAGLTHVFAQSDAARAVVFASYPTVADDVYHAIRGKWPGKVLRHGEEGWQHFRTSSTFRVLVCDRAAEEGLNLHGRGTLLVHYDLPWSPNRVEQRIGRLDRYGVGTAVKSVLPLADGDPLAAAWADYLDRGYRVFDRSVAALQYLTETELAALYPATLEEGAEAVARAADRLAGDEGLVETTLRDIQILDELDAVEAPPGHEDFAAALAQADHERRADWRDAVQTWVGETLQFARRGEGGPEADVWRYQFRRPGGESGASTLMPVDRLARHFRTIIDTDHERSTPRCPLTYPYTFDRRRAQNQKVGLARVGDPFIDALADYVGWDDRGTCSALWRFRPGSKYAKPAEVAFRFEFAVECPTADAVAALPEHEGWSAAAVRRQADWLFPPFTVSVWLDADLEPVTKDARLAALAEPYTKRKQPDGGRDFNLNAERWAAIAGDFPRSDWAAQVRAARKRAEKVVRGGKEWAARIKERVTAATRGFADRDAQADSRLAFLPAAHRKFEKARAAVETAVSDALLQGIESPTLRLDSVGAVFLSKLNPFADVDE